MGSDDLAELVATWDGGALPEARVRLAASAGDPSADRVLEFGPDGMALIDGMAVGDGMAVADGTEPALAADGASGSQRHSGPSPDAGCLRLDAGDGSWAEWLAGVPAAEVTIVGEGGERRLAPPADELETVVDPDRWLAIPGATLDLTIELVSSPVTARRLSITVVDGRCVAAEVEGPDAPVRVTAALVRWLEFRAGRLDVIELLDKGGSVEGPTPLLMCLAGLAEGPEYRSLQRTLPGLPNGLAELSEVWGSRAFRTWQATAPAVIGRG